VDNAQYLIGRVVVGHGLCLSYFRWELLGVGTYQAESRNSSLRPMISATLPGTYLYGTK
jgi:hypothetical protein